MTTKQDLINQCKAENPIMTATVNGELVELNEDEYDVAVNNWAEMRLQQIAEQETKAQAEANKTAILAKLGITADEAKLLLG